MIVALAACGKSAPTKDWCSSYVAELNTDMKGAIRWLGDANKALRADGRDKLNDVIHTAEMPLVLNVCSDALGDSNKERAARGERVITLEHDLKQQVTLSLGNLDTTPVAPEALAELDRRLDLLTQALMK